ncbi:hypothetical protein V495_07294 [Pseudogymnoascus sp. VKM F-4514 (FW-929)]|nr:hypothetical protein V495_07294 [Pseudogymnoascus sp. VKM F-4514 (FW-929)]KFY51860.1 hypothetical protein V497_08797 [Pseudogymnoascus sp. VKM F-4516 (FW-969)]
MGGFPSKSDEGKPLVCRQGSLISASGSDSSAYDHESIIEDINGCIHAGVHGFFNKFFEGKSWSLASQEIVASVDLDKFKTGFSQVDSPPALSILLHEALKLSECDVEYCPVQTPPSQPTLCLGGGIVLFSSMKLEPRAEVVGVLCAVETYDYKAGLLDLCGHARAVFSRRPDRLFVHGFYIFGNIMECWMFDRSGIYSSEVFNAAEDPKRFLTIMAAYAFMSDQEWGRSTLLKDDREGTYIYVKDNTKGPENTEGADQVRDLEKVYLQTPPFYIEDEETIVRGPLVCHRGRAPSTALWNCVVKYKWKPPWHEPEALQLKKARGKQVWGVVQLHGYEVIESTENLRNGLDFGPRQQFRDTENVDQITNPDEMGAAIIGAKALLKPFYENRPNLPKSPGYRSTIFSYLVISPPGLSIYEYNDLNQLLEVLRDAIKAHRSLYQDGGILHRDIGVSNIIIPPFTESPESPKGMLIDLDTAWDISRGPTPQGSIVGTSPFMAIGALEAYVKNNPRTYRHDLESFFYVFLFLAICPRGEDGIKAQELPETSRLLKWELDKRQQVRKTADMGEEGFKEVLKEFSPEFEGLKGLAETLRQILFPVKDGKIWTWTDMSPEGTNQLYDDMIGAFEDARLSIAAVAEPPSPTACSNSDLKAPDAKTKAPSYLSYVLSAFLPQKQKL